MYEILDLISHGLILIEKLVRNISELIVICQYSIQLFANELDKYDDSVTNTFPLITNYLTADGSSDMSANSGTVRFCALDFQLI